MKTRRRWHTLILHTACLVAVSACSSTDSNQIEWSREGHDLTAYHAAIGSRFSTEPENYPFVDQGLDTCKMVSEGSTPEGIERFIDGSTGGATTGSTFTPEEIRFITDSAHSHICPELPWEPKPLPNSTSTAASTPTATAKTTTSSVPTRTVAPSAPDFDAVDALGSTKADQHFLNYLRSRNINYANPNDAVSVGATTCMLASSRVAFDEIVTIVRGQPLSSSEDFIDAIMLTVPQARVVVGAAIVSYCPAYKHLIK